MSEPGTDLVKAGETLPVAPRTRNEINRANGMHGGRPKFKPNDEQKRQVQTMVVAGIPRKLMAKIIGVNKKTFTRAFVSELREAKGRAVMTVVSNLFNMTKKSERACEFFLTNMDSQNWKPMQAHAGPTIIDNSQRQIVYAISENDRKF